ncbi:uncharacterized protein LOC111459965 [Cucurbita moschata]|uniref:Uncharacterized protein LOC111459965 n=1 Tax=Cucurbita moschata TaxID=3662 RepID=A0A6J1H4I1_CUCMO|nr:uncharacterized protein LOC111459965 [Cucurbita moschata]
MVSIGSGCSVHGSASSEPNSSPRISFSSEFLDENDFISITPNSHLEREQEISERQKEDRSEKLAWSADFEFLSNKVSSHSMITADELFFDGKLLPFWQMQQAERLNKISLKSSKDVDKQGLVDIEVNKKAENKVNWLLDDDPSPRPPKCTVLWKELLRLKKQRASSALSPSSSSSSSSSSKSMADAPKTEEGTTRNKEKNIKRIKKGLERTRSGSIRIGPMINVPICTQLKSSVLPPLFPLKKGRFDR